MSNTKNIAGHLLFMLTLGIVCTITGYIVIVLSRLCLFPTRVRVSYCFWVGASIWWLILAGFFSTPDTNKANPGAYDFELVGGNKVVMVQPAQKPLTYTWREYDDHGKPLTEQVYIYGAVDGTNKEFVLSPDPKQIVKRDYSSRKLWLFHGTEEDHVVGAAGEFGPPHMVGKPHLTKEAKKFWIWSTGIMLVIGIMSYIASWEPVLCRDRKES